MNRSNAAASDAETWCHTHTGAAYGFEEYLNRVREFHGHVAPGLLIGGKMVGVNSDRLTAQIRAAGDALLGHHRVRVDPEYLGRKKSGRKTTCPVCGEAYPASQGKICRACDGGSPYIGTTDKKR